MNRISVSMCSVAAVLLLAGCHQQSQERVSTVSLRFAMPPSDGRYALVPVDPHETYAQGQDDQQNPNAPAVEFTEAETANHDEMNALGHAERYFVTMWGGTYDGNDVTYSDLDLAPGDYTFAMWEQDPATTVQGNLTVNYPRSVLLDVLHQWQSRIPELRQQLTYQAEVAGRANNDAESFKAFQRELRALNHLSSRIDRAVWWQENWVKQHEPKYEQFLNQAIVLVLPGDEREIDPRTRAAFCAADVERVRTGEPLTKVLLVADYETTRWKTQIVDGLWRELVACKNVLWEETNRYERRKRILDITDHLYQNDEAFVRNEWQLQATLAVIASIDEQLADLSERRVALAYAAALTSPDEPYRSLDAEQYDLEQEKTMLTAEQERLDALWTSAGTETPKRVDLAAARQRYVRAIAQVQQRLDNLQENRLAVGKLRDASQVLHRSSDARVLAAGVIGDDVPFNIRQAIARDALLTVRLQSQETLFAPRGADTAKARTASHRPL